MPTSRMDARVQCPFYQYDECCRKPRIHRITCEGIVEDSTLVLNYKRRQDFHIQLETFCCEHYQRCEVYGMLMEKYRDAA